MACGQPPEFVEEDPVFTEAAAGSVTAADLARWNQAHTWGDHAAAAYLSQADFAATPAAAITATDFDNWTTASGWGDHSAAGYLTAEADPQFALSTASGITGVDVAAWNAASAFGDHATAGYLTAEGDPAFVASAAAGISAAAISNWNTAASYGNHATAGYLTTSAYAASPAGGIGSTEISSWNAAAGYGDHAAQGYLTSETDPAFAASVSSGITSTQISNWDTAAGYGNHATQGYLTSASDEVSSSVTHRVPRWNGTALVDGSISDTGSLVGIQTSNPAHPLQVGGEGSEVDQVSESWTTGVGNIGSFNQTFTAGSTGPLTRFELHSNGCTPSAPYTVTEGASGTGTVIASGTITFGCSEWSGVNLSPAPNVVAGAVYTITVPLGNDGNHSLLADSTRPYAGGYFFSSGYGVDNYDLAFRTYIQTPPHFAVSGSGAVGIGVHAPQRALHIKDVLRLQPRATAPSGPALGDLYVSSTTNQLMFYNGTAWTAL